MIELKSQNADTNQKHMEAYDNWIIINTQQEKINKTRLHIYMFKVVFFFYMQIYTVVPGPAISKHLNRLAITAPHLRPQNYRSYEKHVIAFLQRGRQCYNRETAQAKPLQNSIFIVLNKTVVVSKLYKIRQIYSDVNKAKVLSLGCEYHTDSLDLMIYLPVV